MEKVKQFKCANGRTYNMPEKHCVFCEHCTDMLFDYTFGPYMFICDKNHSDFRICNSFKEG